MNARLRRNSGVVALLAIAVGLFVWYVTRPYPLGHDRAALAIARARLAACVVGEPVDRHGPNQARIRAIQLANAPDWPARCAPYARAVEAALPHEGGGPAGSGARALQGGDLFEHASLRSDLVHLLTPEENDPTPAWADATRGVPPAPAPAPLATELAPMAQGLRDLDDSGERDLVLALGNETSCRFNANGGGLEAIGRCSYPADALALFREWKLASSRTGDGFVVTSDGVHSFSTGERVVPLPMGDFSKVDVSIIDGTIYAWPGDAKLTTVLRRTPDGKPSPLKVRTTSESMLVGDQLIWRDGKRVLAVSVAGDQPNAPIEVTNLAGRPLPGGCSTHDIAAVLLEVDALESRVALHVNGAWTVSEPGPRYRLRCEGNHVYGLFTSRSGKSTLDIERIDCTSAGCKNSKGSLDGVSEHADVGAIGDATIVVWADNLVRAVSGPVAQLGHEKSFPIFDGFDAEHMYGRPTAGMLVHDVHVFARGKSAIVVVDGEGQRAIHVRDRKPERVAVVFE